MKLNQGDIYLVDLNPTKGHEQSGYRPILVMQNDFLNKNLNTVIVAPLTTNLQAKDKLTTFFLPKNNTKLKQDSVVLLFQTRTIDKKRLTKKVSTLESNIFYEVKKQLNFVFLEMIILFLKNSVFTYRGRFIRTIGVRYMHKKEINNLKFKNKFEKIYNL